MAPPLYVCVRLSTCVPVCSRVQCGGFRRSTVDVGPSYTATHHIGIGGELDFNQSSPDVGVYYAVSASTFWVPAAVYDCPSGYHWASTAEGQQFFTGKPEGTGAFDPYPPNSRKDTWGAGGRVYCLMSHCAVNLRNSHIVACVRACVRVCVCVCVCVCVRACVCVCVL